MGKEARDKGKKIKKTRKQNLRLLKVMRKYIYIRFTLMSRMQPCFS